MPPVSAYAPPSDLLSSARSSHPADIDRPPIFGFILCGGALVGAQVRDVRLANELVRRGYPVHVWWAFDRPHESPLDPSIAERLLFPASRYSGHLRSRQLDDWLGRAANRFLSDRQRAWITQHYPNFMGQQL